MDLNLATRLAIFDADSQTPTGVVPFVRAELTRIDPKETLTDDELGIFVSHLVMALTRLLNRADIPPEIDAETYAEVLTEQPDSRAEAEALTDRIAEIFRVTPPESEIQYLTVHLALIATNLK